MFNRDAAFIDTFDDSVGQSVFQIGVREPDGVFDSLRCRCAVSDDADSANAEQGRSAEFLRVGDLFQIPERLFCEERSRLTDRVAGECLFQPVISRGRKWQRPCRRYGAA